MIIIKNYKDNIYLYIKCTENDILFRVKEIKKILNIEYKDDFISKKDLISLIEDNKEFITEELYIWIHIYINRIFLEDILYDFKSKTGPKSFLYLGPCPGPIVNNMIKIGYTDNKDIISNELECIIDTIYNKQIFKDIVNKFDYRINQEQITLDNLFTFDFLVEEIIKILENDVEIFNFKEEFMKQQEELIKSQQNLIEITEKRIKEKIQDNIDNNNINNIKLLSDLIYELDISLTCDIILLNNKDLIKYLIDNKKIPFFNDLLIEILDYNNDIKINFSIIKLLIDNNLCNINANNDISILQLAIFHDRTDIALYLLNKGVDIDYKDNKDNKAIHYACMYENVKVVKKLLEKNINIHEKNKDNDTPINIICKTGDLYLLQLLYNYSTHDKDVIHKCLIDICKFNRFNFFKFFIRRKYYFYDILYYCFYYENYIHFNIYNQKIANYIFNLHDKNKNKYINYVHDSGKTLLIQACMDNNFNFVRILLSQSCIDKNIKFEGKTAYEYITKDNIKKLFDKPIEECPICYEDKEILALNCNHTICYDCIDKWNAYCPFCRKNYNFN